MDETGTGAPDTLEAQLESMIEFARHETLEASRLHEAVKVIQEIERLVEWDDAKKLRAIAGICELAIGQPMTDDEGDGDG